MTYAIWLLGPTSARGSSAPYAAVYPGAISVNRSQVPADLATAVAPAAPPAGLGPSVAEAATPPTAQAAPPVALEPANLSAQARMLEDSAKPAERHAQQTASERDPKPGRARRWPQAAWSPARRPPVLVWASASA
jgi:hypothetical protein